MDLLLFEEVGEAVRSLVPPELGRLHLRAGRYGIKVWFGPAEPTREHYEAQVIGPRDVPDAAALAIEVGFHAEHRDPVRNDEVLRKMLASEAKWRRALGPEPVAGPFLGRLDDWRRISETWPDPDLGDPELGLALGARLVDYVSVLEPLRN